MNDVEIVVIPPVNMVAFLESGEIDGFCVGGPWNAKAVRSRIGTTVVTSFDIWPDTPEKVLGVLSVWQERYPQSLVAICVALLRACQYLMTIPNRFEAARLLTKQRYLDEPLDVIAPSMLGSCLVTEHEPPREIPQYNQFSLDSQPALNRPNWQSATQLLSHMVDAGQICRESVDAEQLQHIYRDDVFAQAQRFTS